MSSGPGGKRALVTGWAGLIGSHLSDLLLRQGCKVRILDNLEPQTHRNGKPSWISQRAEFANVDIRDRAATRVALEDVDLVFHLADGLLRSVEVPADEHRVEFRYGSWTLRAGVAISLVAYAALIVLAVAAGLQHRRKDVKGVGPVAATGGP